MSGANSSSSTHIPPFGREFAPLVGSSRAASVANAEIVAISRRSRTKTAACHAFFPCATLFRSVRPIFRRLERNSPHWWGVHARHPSPTPKSWRNHAETGLKPLLVTNSTHKRGEFFEFDPFSVAWREIRPIDRASHCVNIGWTAGHLEL